MGIELDYYVFFFFSTSDDDAALSLFSFSHRCLPFFFLDPPKTKKSQEVLKTQGIALFSYPKANTSELSETRRILSEAFSLFQAEAEKTHTHTLTALLFPLSKLSSFPISPPPSGGCTVQAIGFNDNYKKFADKGYAVFGISADSPTTQANWRAKHSFQYNLICDRSLSAIKKLGWAKAGGGRNVPVGGPRGRTLYPQSRKPAAAQLTSYHPVSCMNASVMRLMA